MKYLHNFEKNKYVQDIFNTVHTILEKLNIELKENWIGGDLTGLRQWEAKISKLATDIFMEEWLGDKECFSIEIIKAVKHLNIKVINQKETNKFCIVFFHFDFVKKELSIHNILFCVFNNTMNAKIFYEFSSEKNAIWIVDTINDIPIYDIYFEEDKIFKTTYRDTEIFKKKEADKNSVENKVIFDNLKRLINNKELLQDIFNIEINNESKNSDMKNLINLKYDVDLNNCMAYNILTPLLNMENNALFKEYI